MEKRDSSIDEQIKTAQHDDSTLLEITTSGRKLVIVTVGLPGRGKTYLATKLSAHLTWLGFGCQRFTLSDHRSLVGATSYLDPITEKGQNDVLLYKVLDVMTDFLRTGGQISILDGSHSTWESRAKIKEFLYQCDLSGEILWVEKITNDPDILAANIAGMRRSPGLIGKHHAEVQAIMKERVQHHETSYMSMRDEDIDDENEGYIKIISYKEDKKKIISYNVDGYLCGRVMFFLQNLRMDHNNRPPIWMSRHGESMHNTKGLLGGNSNLSPKGNVYSSVLADWVEVERAKEGKALKGFDVWCSTLKRTMQTASPVAQRCHVRMTPRKNLDEIESGIYDSYTYEKIKAEAPHEFKARKHDKLRYRYPQGESYLDVIDRLEPIIFELERKRSPVLIIGHQAVLRCLYGYFTDKPIHTLPHNPMPLHTVIKLYPGAYGCDEERFDLEPKVEKRYATLQEPHAKL